MAGYERFEGQKVKLDQLKKAFYKGHVFKNRPDENCHTHATIQNIQRKFDSLVEKHKLDADSIDYYGARNLIIQMLDFLGTAEENHMVEMIPGLGNLPFWGDFSKFDRWSFYVDYYNIIDRDDDGKLTMNEIEDVYKDILAEYPNCAGFERDVDKFMAEVKRRYDLNKNDYLTLEEARELCFCFAPFLKNLPKRPESPESDDETPEIESYGDDVHNEADTTIDSESEIEDEVDAVSPTPPRPLSPTPEEKAAIVKDKNIIGHINGEMAEILLDFVTAADETLNDDYTLFPEKKVATLWAISSLKELDARYAKRVRTATAELIVYAKSMIKFMKEYSNAMAKIDEMAFLQGKVNRECKVKIKEFKMLQTRFSQMSSFEPHRVEAVKIQEDPVKHDQLVLEKFVAEVYVKLVDVQIQRLNIPERDFTEIKFATKVARIMAFTLTKMRDQIISHVNKQANKIQSFKEDMINKLVTYDCLQDFMGRDHWLNCSYEEFSYVLKAALPTNDSELKKRLMADLLNRNTNYIKYSKTRSIRLRSHSEIHPAFLPALE